MKTAAPEIKKEKIMKKQIIGTLTVLSLFFVLAVTSVQAQQRGTLKAHIPFAFSVNEQTLEAGDYTISRLTENSIVIESADGRHRVIAQVPRTVSTNPNAAQNLEKLVFHQYGDQYFLAQVWMIRATDGRELNRSKSEAKAADEMRQLAHNRKPRNVQVAMR
ncbi:MAG: hypothetical protein AUG51_01390 [Acidobacteria bacterium 13_1_20CM_3_53_8]|nr:MAG: hypothetical protein AUG51_01390 [Acidobacteria bacterium 13_1_20CM_3_53_8]